MRFLSALLVSLLSFSAFALLDEPMVDSFEMNSLLSEDQAIELGMTKKSELNQLQAINNTKAILKGLNINDDAANSKKAKIVVIINDGIRSGSNPEGQTLKLYQDGILVNIYDVSTGSHREVTTTSGNVYVAKTPIGFYRPKRAYYEYYSKSFYGSNMKYAVFFHLGFATHTTSATWRLGTRASGGCVRMHEEDARTVNETLIETGEPHRKTATETICDKEGENCLGRTLYLNRIRLHDISSGNATPLSKRIWTYPSLFIVKSGK